MKIEIENYNLEKIKRQIIKKLILEKPYHSRAYYAKQLGISERQFYRWLLEYKISIPKLTNKTDRVISYLESKGYEVKKVSVNE